MDLTPHTLGEYCALLEPQLAAPLPEGLDLSQSVALVSCDSQEVVPALSFCARAPTSRRPICPRPPSGARWPM